MLHINGCEIQLTRGDTAYLEIPLTVLLPDDTTEPYEMAIDDTLVLTVRSAATDPTICFQKKLVGSNVFHILPNDTCDCAFGKYKYDVQLTKANGDVFTVIEPTCFKLLPEVTY